MRVRSFDTALAVTPMIAASLGAVCTHGEPRACVCRDRQSGLEMRSRTGPDGCDSHRRLGYKRRSTRDRGCQVRARFRIDMRWRPAAGPKTALKPQLICPALFGPR